MADGSRTEEAGTQLANDLWDAPRRALRSQFSPESIATLPDAQLLAIRIAPDASESALAGPLIVLPTEWMPAGRNRNLSMRSLDLRRALPTGMDAEGPVANAVFMSLRRMMLAFWTVPYVARHDVSALPKPGTWMTWCRNLIQKTHWALSNRPSDDGQIFAHLDLDSLADMMKACPDKTSVFDHLTQFRHRGILNDWPDIAVLERNQNDARTGKEKNRKGQEAPTSESKEAQQWQPLPDQFVADLGWRSKWLIERLGPALLDCFESCCAVSTGCKRTIQVHRKKIIAEWDWRTSDGEKIASLPFALRLSGVNVETWPPSTWEMLQQAVYVLQGINLFVSSLAMAGRMSEVLSLRDGAVHTGAPSEAAEIDVVEMMDGDAGDQSARIAGRTYKLIERIGGAERDWTIPPIVAKALILQKRLARMLRPVGTDHLWVQVYEAANGAGMGSPLNHITEIFNSLVNKFELQDALGKGGSFHHHRCRKTVARLVGLALVGAPKILMDLFGHRTIEMTLSYILSDPDFAAEVRELAKAQIIIMGKKAIESADKNGGPVAPEIRKAAEVDKALRGEDGYGTKDIYHLAEVLTLNGRTFQLVRPGVICTKGPGEVGPCSKGKARIDTSSCKEDCRHRLELAALRDDVDRSIAECIRHLERALAEDDEINAECWRGQLLHHLPRFPDLLEKWKRHPTVAGLAMSVKEDVA